VPVNANFAAAESDALLKIVTQAIQTRGARA
jgi:hypothetical protein